jgi:predicted Fe-S protein YdhL (DUF1289 family)
MSTSKENGSSLEKRKCIKICKLDSEKVYCVGCNRTLEEIRNAYSRSLEK